MCQVLVVEDDRNQQLLIQEELEEEGYTIATVGSAQEALDHMNAQMPDVVVLDLHLPGKDGIELLGEILSINNHIPVVIHSAFASYKESFMTWAADAYVVKEPSFCRLKEAIREVVEKQHVAS